MSDEQPERAEQPDGHDDEDGVQDGPRVDRGTADAGSAPAAQPREGGSDTTA